MDDLNDIKKYLELDNSNVLTNYDYRNVFENPNKLPINQVHLTKTITEIRKGINLENIDQDPESYYQITKQVIPALDKVWIIRSTPVYSYHPFNFVDNVENRQEKNLGFLKFLNYMLSCNYHQFWCMVLYHPQVCLSLHSFLLNPIFPHMFNKIEDEVDSTIFQEIFMQFLFVYNRLITFKESETEFMSDEVGLKYLLEKKLINLPIVISLILLYENTDKGFIEKLLRIYHKEESIICSKEIEETLNQILMTLEMIGGHICGFEPGTVIVPIAIEERPSVFELNWVYSVVNYLYCTITTLHILLKNYKTGYKIAIEKGIPYRLSYIYEKVFYELYQYLDDRPEIDDNPKLMSVIIDEIALCRSEIIDVYHSFITNCLDKALKSRDDHIVQQEIVEDYLKLLNTALDDEFFISDYHQKYDVGLQNEMFASCTELDETRSNYILDCINSYKRHNRLHAALSTKNNLEKTFRKYAPHKPIEIEETHRNGDTAIPSTSQPKITNGQPSEEDIENMIRMVIDMFPHLGDGFVLQCLQTYDYQPSEVITAILEQNLAPHLLEIPFDTIRIPEEPKPEEPILKYKGKKPGFDDALKLLNDKKDMWEIKTYILDGIQYTNEYDVYDDEYDDRLEEEIVKVPDYGSEDILKYNPNHDDDAVSDTSYSENEYDDDGRPVDEKAGASTSGRNDSRAFCEDPAKIRERREAARASQQQNRRRFDVTGKPKGQGQEKDVLHNRQKKNVNKSSRANHNRKSGAQWKRNRGMMPS